MKQRNCNERGCTHPPTASREGCTSFGLPQPQFSHSCCITNCPLYPFAKQTFTTLMNISLSFKCCDFQQKIFETSAKTIHLFSKICKIIHQDFTVQITTQNSHLQVILAYNKFNKIGVYIVTKISNNMCCTSCLKNQH